MEVFYLTPLSVDKLKALWVQSIEGMTLKRGKEDLGEKSFPLLICSPEIPNCVLRCDQWKISCVCVKETIILTTGHF